MRLALACLIAAASIAAAPPSRAETPARPEMMTASFLAAHPDVKFRMDGMRAIEDNLPEAAFKAFRDASRYADKGSQAMVAVMYWAGNGVAQDRAIAYAWMDLAAERGYKQFLGLREKYWNALTSDERERAVKEGETVYAEYGDAVAKPRLARKLDSARRKITGSRTGFVGSLKVMVPGPGGDWISLDGSTYYADRYWRPKDYFEWQDQIMRTPQQGVVDVGPISTADATPPPKD
jgi:hypothetical protein